MDRRFDFVRAANSRIVVGNGIEAQLGPAIDALRPDGIVIVHDANLGELAASHSAGKEIKLEKALDGMPVPLHPGAARYLKEKGLKAGS